ARTCGRAALARGVEPHLADDALVALEAALDDHVDEKVQQALDVAAREAPSAATLLDQEHQLLERELGAGRVHAGYGSRMTRVDVAQVIERLLGRQLGEQDAVGPHSEAALEQLLRRDARETLVVLAVEQAHVIRMPVEHELASVLDGDESLIAGNLPDQRLGPGGLAGSGRTRDHDVLARAHREAQERRIRARGVQAPQLLLGLIALHSSATGGSEHAPARELIDRPDSVSGAADGDGDASERGRR